jgi:hypothetical protein
MKGTGSHRWTSALECSGMTLVSTKPWCAPGASLACSYQTKVVQDVGRAAKPVMARRSG